MDTQELRDRGTGVIPADRLHEALLLERSLAEAMEAGLVLDAALAAMTLDRDVKPVRRFHGGERCSQGHDPRREQPVAVHQSATGPEDLVVQLGLREPDGVDASTKAR